MADKSKKVLQKKLSPEVYSELEAVVGKRWISEQRSLVETYSKLSIEGMTFVRKHQKDETAIPACVILPETTEEVQKIVIICNTHKIPFFPFTNGKILLTKNNDFLLNV